MIWNALCNYDMFCYFPRPHVVWLCDLKRKYVRAQSWPAPFLLSLPSVPHPPPSPSCSHNGHRQDRSPRLRYLSLCWPSSRLLTPRPSPVSPTASRSPSPVSAHDILTLRALVNTKEAGVIIGKAGKNVAELREQARVKAGVSKVTPGVHERVLTVSGSVDAVAKVVHTPALRSLFLLTLSSQSRPTPTSSPNSSHQVHIPLPYHRHPRPTPRFVFSSLTI